MEYEFKRELGGAPYAKLSMGHEAVAQWINDELSTLSRTEQLLHTITEVENGTKSQVHIKGIELELAMSHSEVSIMRGEIEEHDTQEYEDSLSIYASESNAECGLPDFKETILAWKAFISQ